MTTKLATGALFLCLLLSLSANAQQTFKIAKIEFEGLNRQSADETLATAGLKIGDVFNEASADAAAQRLIDSGLFKNVGYKTTVVKDQMTIVFRVEEAKVTSSRVIFDNFIWFTDAELIAAVQREIPSFNGSAPDNGDVVERVTKALQRFLHENKIEATVNYMASQDSVYSSNQEHVFSVIGVPMPICSIHFSGTNNVTEPKLIEASKPLFGNDYSNKFVSAFAVSTLLPIYRRLGLLKAAFAPPTAKIEESSTCKFGVDLTMGIDEGVVYKWHKADWSGISALSAAELDTAIGMTPGQTADGLKIDKMPTLIQGAYGRKGYLTARAKPHPQFDDGAKTVSYKIDIVEGPQFRMGKLILKGLPVDASKSVEDKWKLKSGDIFDEGYFRDFVKTSLSEILKPIYFERRAQSKAPPNVKTATTPNRTNLTVDVTIEITN
jgi:outer membrane protein assembly factor BamA